MSANLSVTNAATVSSPQHGAANVNRTRSDQAQAAGVSESSGPACADAGVGDVIGS
jgi:hypothetical protein